MGVFFCSVGIVEGVTSASSKARSIRGAPAIFPEGAHWSIHPHLDAQFLNT
jgi:hypothetical protein